MIHYQTTEQITKVSKNYKFELPKYGKSTTDPTYYEPSATRIANMRKSAQAAKSLYDFTGEDLPKDENGNPDWSKQNISNARIVPGRKPGLTREEISQNYQDALNDVQNMTEDKKAEIQAKKEQIETAKQISKSINEDTQNQVDKSE